jgi:hypothetical protein
MLKQIIQETNRRILGWIRPLSRLVIDDPRTWFGKIFLALSLLTISQTANAGPVIAVVAAVGGFLGFSGAAAIVVGAVALGAAVYASVAFLGYLGMKMPDLSNQESATKQAEGVQIQRRGSVEQIPVVYGFRRIAGIVTFATTGNDKNKYLWVCYTFCEGPVEGLVKLYVDDWDIDTDNPGSGAGNTVPAYLNACVSETKVANKPVSVTWGKYKDRVKLFFSKGEYFTNPAAITVNDYVLGAGGVFEGVPTGDNGYKKEMVHNGLCTIWARYEWIAGEDNPFTGSIPLLHIELQGRKVTPLYTQSNIANQNNPYNTKVTSTETGAYGTNERYSTNPVECLLDYLRNPRYGKGLKNDDIDWDSWYKSANKCNQMVPSSVAGQTHRILTLNAVVQTDATIMNNVKTLLQNFRAYMPYQQGKYKLKIEDAGNETDILSGVATIKRTFSTLKSSQKRGINPPIDNIIGDVTYTGIERSAKYNEVVVQYVEPDEKFTNQSVTYPPTEANGKNPDGTSYFGRQYYFLQDGSRDYRYEITLPGITNRDTALDMARLIFNKSRYQETCTLTVTSEALNLELGDNVYISSTVLDFIDPVDSTNTIPWRIVSMTLQDNHSIQLQCVRNPDFIYPHVRAGEKDKVLAIYVPKGADRQLAQNIELYPRGIVPPTKASLPAGETVSSNPLINANPSNVAPSNNTVSTTTVSNPLADTITITSIRTVFISGQAYLILTWCQPSEAMFRSLLITATAISGSGTTSPALNFEYIGSPVDGEVVEYQIGPVAPGPNSTYSIVSRIKYSTLQQSTATSTFFASVDAPATSTTTTTNTTTSTTTAPSTTTPPPTTTPVYTPAVATTRDNYCATLVGDVTAANYAADPRVITWTLTLNQANSDAIGFNYYIKPTVETYWRPFQGRNSGNVAFNPSLPTQETLTLTNVGRATAFDLIIRVAYKDGTESTKQQRFSFNITSPFNVYPYNFFYGLNATASPTPLQDTSSFTPLLTPPGFVGTAADIKMSIVSTQFRTTNGILFNLNPPAPADRIYWYGQTIRYRPFTPGANPPFTTVLDKNVTPIVDGTIPVIISPIVFDQKYEFVITPYVSVGNVKQDSNFSWYGVGSVNNSTTSIIYPPDGNWNFNFNWQNVATSTALQTINTSFAPLVMADAVVQMSRFDSYNVNGNFSAVTVDNGTSFVLQSYHRLVYSGVGITNFKGVRIYRRSLQPPSGGVNESTGGAFAKYFGWGRWEYIDTTATTVNLRGPTAAAEFNAYYEVAGYTGNTNLLSRGYQSLFNGLLANNGKNQILAANGGNQQFLIVVQFNDNSFSTKGLLINVARSNSSSPNPYNQLKPNLPTEVTLATFNSYTAGYNRNLSEARSVLASTAIGVTSSQPFAPSGTTASITKFVTYPTTDSTIGGSITPAIQ